MRKRVYSYLGMLFALIGGVIIGATTGGASLPQYIAVAVLYVAGILTGFSYEKETR